MSDFDGRAASSIGPATRLRMVTPDDGVDLPDGPSRGLFVGGAGAVVVTGLDGAPATIVSGEAQYHPIRVRRVHATGTAATDIVALY